MARTAKRRRVPEARQEGPGRGQVTETAAETPVARRWGLIKLTLAGLAVLVAYGSIRYAARAAWSYDEYFHLAFARDLREHFPVRSFPTTPFSLLATHFADGAPLFHLLLVPLARLSLPTAGLLGVLLLQAIAYACFGAAVWRIDRRSAWAYTLALAGLGSLFGTRVDMCRPQLLLIGLVILFVALLVTGARNGVLAVVAAVFGLAHAGGWIAIPIAAAYGAMGWLLPAKAGRGSAPQSAGTEGRRFQWRPLVWVAVGWLAGQLVHPNVPQNLRLLAIVNFEIPFEASPAGNEALRSQLGFELSPPEWDILSEQWPVLLAAALVAVILFRDRRLRTRATLTCALLALAFTVVGALLIRRFLEIGGPLCLLALAAFTAERRRQQQPPALGTWTAWVATGTLVVAILWTGVTLRSYGFGKSSPPQAMAEWLGANGKPGERVFTGQWADSAPLYYAAPQLQTLVALDPTMFFAKDPEGFALYVDIVQGRRPDAVAQMRGHFGAHWATLWLAPLFGRFDEQVIGTPGVRVAYRDGDYIVADLGAAPPPARLPAAR